MGSAILRRMALPSSLPVLVQLRHPWDDGPLKQNVLALFSLPFALGVRALRGQALALPLNHVYILSSDPWRPRLHFSHRQEDETSPLRHQLPRLPLHIQPHRTFLRLSPSSLVLFGTIPLSHPSVVLALRMPARRAPHTIPRSTPIHLIQPHTSILPRPNYLP